MSTDLQNLYQDIILDHSRRPRNFRAIEGARHAQGHNPLCGDRLEVYLRLDGDRITDASFQGSGCAIAKASASLMTEAITGRTLAEAEALAERFEQMITAPADPALAELGELRALAGVRQFPARLKCASLAWHALRAVRSDYNKVASTE